MDRQDSLEAAGSTLIIVKLVLPLKKSRSPYTVRRRTKRRNMLSLRDDSISLYCRTTGRHTGLSLQLIKFIPLYFCFLLLLYFLNVRHFSLPRDGHVAASKRGSRVRHFRHFF